MALDFTKSNGEAKKSSINYYKMKDGDNAVRLVGGILPRYMYWVKTPDGKNLPFECLAFNRDTERFDRAEKDYVQEKFPDLKCGWSYAMNVYDPEDGEVKVFTLKKKLFAQIQEAAADLGDPTDLDTGWTVKFKKVKTGPNAFNVEYTLQVLKCKSEALSDEAKEKVNNAKTIDDLFPRPTADEQKAQLDALFSTESNADDDIATEMDDEIPF